ncbi:MAG: biotin/lipoyl-containing protein, partial [Planctomycetota bacterium]
MYIVKYPEKGRFSAQGIVVQWNLDQGQSVQKGDLLLQIEAAGELLEVTCDSEGTVLKVLADVGSLVQAGQPLAVIGQAKENVEKALEQISKSTQPESSPTVQAKPKAKEVAQSDKATPSKKEEIMTAPQSTGNPDNVTPILMPQAGQSMEEGTILGWKVAEGDVIEVGQIIMEIETDKATMEVEATDAGRVAKIIAQEGAIVEVKKPVALIADSDDDANAFLAGEGAPIPAAK